MPLDVTCPHCGYGILAVSEQRQDKVEECPSCGKLVKLSAPRRSRLFSCLVILMVVGAGLFLLSIPGILAFREAGRRMTCSWHLKQIGLALHNYHDSYGSFPPPY